MDVREREELATILDSVDTLNAAQVDAPKVYMPMVVCGEQSYGKSSTLGRIAGVAYPTSQKLCTRFPVKTILRRGAQRAEVLIRPDPRRPKDERERLEKFFVLDVNTHDLDTVYASA
ncbi:hypothetical protein G647_10416 [Cladophialophora carrionii CBS 160.54]|uniref:Dynamin N-terminal domain-containing protein n=1 Tax=Cladophialophora carrionii CBS 160.54 TaxID=1279043 RepID=V9DKX4_9EURO|nr:uncharacterized protein G647_10416 [Cladophialophora carrionii CBS 160.54]ETI26602.1 hypothetical protein G647_10416 [Cladophialophora carrionii CBS 160.54]